MQLPVEAVEGEAAAPEFGFDTGRAAQGVPTDPPLTWAAMRRVGAGFWLTNRQVSRLLLLMCRCVQFMSLMMCCTALRCSCAVLCCAVPSFAGAVQCCAVLCCAVLCYAVQRLC